MKAMIGRKVRGWGGIEGKVLEWEPLGAGMTDTLVESSDGRRVWVASHELRPTDGKGPLPSRERARIQADQLAQRRLRKIQEHVVRDIKEGPRWQGAEFGKALVGRGVVGARKAVQTRLEARDPLSRLEAMLDPSTLDHLAKWVKHSVYDDERNEVLGNIARALEEEPNLIERNLTWPEISKRGKQ